MSESIAFSETFTRVGIDLNYEGITTTSANIAHEKQPAIVGIDLNYEGITTR